MNHNKTLNASVEVVASNRPIKIAYIISAEEAVDNQMILDAVFHECYMRWAGALTLLIPSNNEKFIDEGYEHWLEYFDPDFVYSYVNILPELINKIEKLCRPIGFYVHTPCRGDKNNISWESYLPRWIHDFEAVSSKTIVNSPEVHHGGLPRHLQAAEDERYVLTQLSSKNLDRVFSDNFGKKFTSHTQTIPEPGVFKTISYAPFSSVVPDSEVHICKTLASVLDAINVKNAIPISRLARLHSESIPKIASHKWVKGFTLYVGNSVLDRVNFWNARNLIPHQTTYFGALIFPIMAFDDEQLAEELGRFWRKNNFGSGSGPAVVSIRSFTHQHEELARIKTLLQKHTHNMIVIEHDLTLLALPTVKLDYEGVFIENLPDATTLRLTEVNNKLLAQEPDHFGFSPANFRSQFSGQWIVMLNIQRHLTSSKYAGEKERWMLPKKNNVVAAFTSNAGKVSACHRLALLPQTDRLLQHGFTSNRKHRYDLRLPSDDLFFSHLVTNKVRYATSDLRFGIDTVFYEDIGISDKGQGLRGVISMFDSLFTAYGLLTSHFWRQVLRESGQRSVKKLTYLNKLEARLPNNLPTKVRLKEQLDLPANFPIKKLLIASLIDSLEFLVQKNVFFRAHNWRCEYCGHSNTRSFDEIKILNHCDICNLEYFTPIDVDWHYEINEFLYRALVEHNELTVLWTLGCLQDREVRASFYYMPEVNLYKGHESNGSEIDILCMIDGNFCAAEAQKTASSFIIDEPEIESFVEKMQMLNPNIAYLSFEKYCRSDNEYKDDELRDDPIQVKKNFSIVMAKIESLLGPKIKFKFLVAEDYGDYFEYEIYWGSRVSAMLRSVPSRF